MIRIGDREISTGTIVAALIILGFLWYTGTLQGWIGMSQVGTFSQTSFYQGDQEADAAEVPAEAPIAEKPVYSLAQLTMYVKDKLNPKAGIPNVTVDVYAVPATYTYDDLAALATDPYANVIDSAVSDANGEVVFTKGVIRVGEPYLYALKGDSNVYDKLVVKTVPVPSKYFAVTTYTFRDPEYVYKVGAFKDPNIDADNILSGSEFPELNATGKSGLQYFEFDLEIGNDQPGTILKDVVLVIRTPETTVLEPGAIQSIYVVRKQGTDLGIPVYNLAANINSRPIKLKTTYDEDLKANVMTVADSAIYTVKLTYDADLIKNGDEIEFVLDDLGDYRGQDVGTLNTKASPAKVVIQFVK